jgi:predicted HTH transcriptional regulator
MNIHEFLKQFEGNSIDAYPELPSREDLAKSICAFSNGAGGTVVIGYDTRTEQVLGLRSSAIIQLERSIKKDIWELVEPLPSVYPKVLVCKDKKLFAVSVLPGNLKPYFLKGQDKFSGTYVRTGSTNQLADATVIAELDRIADNISYETTPAYDADVEDLNSELIEEYMEFREQNSSIPKVLVNYAFMEKNNIITRERGKIYPTVFGILCFSDKASDYFSKAKIKCKTYEKEDKSKLLDIEVFSGPIIKQVSKALKYFNDLDIPDKSFEALLVNAIVHRDYAITSEPIVISVFTDRVEIISPGLLPVGINLDELGKGICVYKNSNIYRIFSEMGYTFQENTGIQNANAILAENNYHPIQFSVKNNALVATILLDTVDDFLSKEEMKVLAFIETNEHITNAQCQKLLRVKGKQAQYILTKLVKKKKLISTGEKKGRKYFLC